MANAWNLFRVGRQRGQEDQLTEMLAWLADAVPEVGRSLIRLGFGDERLVDGDFELTTQYGIVGGRLDALLTSPTVALVVESKLSSTYGANQIRRYLEWLERDFSSRPVRGLMTLTAQEAAWPTDDVAYAEARHIVASARRWADLHVLLEPLAERDELAERLVREFLEMLSEEGLIPVQPLTAEEMATAWANAWTVVRRYRDFFHACKKAVEDAMGASPVSNSWSDRGDWFWQDYMYEDGIRVVVGLFHTDESEKIPTSARTRSPILWMAVKADHVEDWPALAAALEANPPEGWVTGRRWWGERPNVWRPLAPLLTGESFEEQREQLASATAAARAWIDHALERGEEKATTA